ncbi:MAG TPA: hypothetical protein VLZ76_06170 [Lysobacter sp.]|jgi:hypothetical protein|nr:hypothetical protein [Lysobacter sp.]
MKKSYVLLIAAALVFSGTAYAEVKIGGNNTQKTNVKGAIANSAVGAMTKATQNISSNKGNVKIGGNNNQTTDVMGAIANSAVGAGSKAEQNVSSNEGN